MKNMTTRDFCMRFYACEDGTEWALEYADMHTCYDALLAGEAGVYSTSWAIWTATRKGVMSDRDLRLFAVRCARRVQHLMRDARSISALDVAERYALGQATEAELTAAKVVAKAEEDAAWASATAEEDAAWASATAEEASSNAAAWAAWAAAWAAEAAAEDAAWAATRNAASAARVAAGHATAAVRDVAWYAACEAEREEQLKLLAEFGNPFEGEAEE